MAWVAFLPGQVNSPSTTLTGDINDVVDVIPVAELGVFPTPGATGSLAVIGTGSTAETIHYAAKSAATGAGNLTGCTRAYDSDGTYGVAASWYSGETIARNFCAHDFETICGNVEDHSSRHESGGDDAIKLDDLAAPDDVTDLDVSITAHGLCPKLSNIAANYLNGVGAWDTVQETDLGFSDLTTSNANTTKHGFLIKATAPAAGVRNVVAIDNAETVYKNTALVDTTNPELLGTIGPGSSLLAARRDHVHANYTAAGVGIGIGVGAAPSYLLEIKGTAATDLPTYSAEFLDADNWTSADWTGSWAAGWAHTPGNTTILSHDHAAVNATKYQITYTVTGRTAGTFTITFGGQTSAAISATGAWGPTSTGTGVLQITPTTTFDGTIVISINSLTAVSTPSIVLTQASGGTVGELRSHNLNTNLFIGLNAGGYTTTGSANTAIGGSTLANNTTGRYNVAIGYSPLLANTTGESNMAVGFNCLVANLTGSRNAGIGRSSLYSCVSGNDNNAFGYYSLLNTTGSQNTAVGGNAGSTNTTGSTNTYIGYYAGLDANQLATATNTMGLGANTFTTRNNQVVIGNASIVETHLRTGVYIGSTSTTAHTQPTARLHIAAGSATASTAPLKLTSGPVNTTAEAGAIEFLTDDFYASITTGPARKKIALARSDWGAWVPTLTWGTSDPAAITTVARYCQIDRVVFFHLDISSADSNATDSLTITLPVDPVDNNDYTSVSSREIAGAGGATWSDPLGYINMDSADKKINFAAFTTGTDDQAIRIIVSGSYEVT